MERNNLDWNDPEDGFDALWQTMTQALREPVLLAVHPATTPGADGVERFHAWFDPGGDGKPEAIWTKPLQGTKQVRLSHRRKDFRRVYDAVTRGTHGPEQVRDVTLRGHYLYTLMRHYGWTPGHPLGQPK